MTAPIEYLSESPSARVPATAARVARKRQFGYALKRRIAALDPEQDHEQLARLTLEVLYGDRIGVHAALLIGFSRQVAVPSIARVIYRGGGGDTLSHIDGGIDDYACPVRRIPQMGSV